MRDAQCVQMLDGLRDLKEDALALLLRQAALSFNVGAQVAAVQALHDQVHALWCLHCLVHARYARVRDLLHNLDLRVHTLPVRGVLELAFIVSLDRHLGARQTVPGCAHFAVAAHAHHLAHHVHVHHGRAGRDDATASAG